LSDLSGGCLAVGWLLVVRWFSALNRANLIEGANKQRALLGRGTIVTCCAAGQL